MMYKCLVLLTVLAVQQTVATGNTNNGNDGNQCVSKEDMASEMETMKADVQTRLQFQFNYWRNITTNIMFSLQINTVRKEGLQGSVDRLRGAVEKLQHAVKKLTSECCNDTTIIPPESCASLLYVIAFTSGITYAAGSDHSPYIAIRLTTGETNTRLLYDLTGNDMFPHKGDLWKFQISDFGFTTSCITKSKISQVSIREGGRDNWNIESIMTVLSSADGNFEILTANFHVNRWIDQGSNREYFLTKV